MRQSPDFDEAHRRVETDAALIVRIDHRQEVAQAIICTGAADELGHEFASHPLSSRLGIEPDRHLRCDVVPAALAETVVIGVSRHCSVDLCYQEWSAIGYQFAPPGQTVLDVGVDHCVRVGGCYGALVVDAACGRKIALLHGADVDVHGR